MSIQAEPRHQCLIYSGAPSKCLPALAELLRSRLAANFRCLCLNSPTMIAGIRSYLSALGVDVSYEMARANLVLTSDRGHLLGGKFDPQRMLSLLKENLDQALLDGHAGLWAAGDMAWEFGPEQNFDKLVEYERGLDALLRANPRISGLCQYCADNLPREVMRQGLALHPGLFVGRSITRMNPHFVPPGRSEFNWPASSLLEKAVEQICDETDAASEIE